MSSPVMEKVQKIIADALYVDAAAVTADASLMRDLGAESIDFLDIMFRLEREFAIKIPKGEIEAKARGGLSGAEFAVGGLIQARGLDALRRAMPEADQSDIKVGLHLRDIPGLFTVRTFEGMVLHQLGQAPAATPATPRAPASALS